VKPLAARPVRTLLGAWALAAGAAGPHPTQRPARAARPGSYVYPLRVGPTGRYLVDEEGRPFLLIGDAAWSLIAQAREQDADAYLADRQRLGFDAILVNLIEHKFAAHAPADAAGERPFLGRAFTRPNEAYFARADRVIADAARRGILVLLAPDYLGYGCGDEGWCAETRAASLSEMHAWGRYVGRRYRAFDNIVWVVGGDADPTPVLARLEAMVGGIRSADPRHLFTAHNARGQMGVAPWPGATWLTVNDIYTRGLEHEAAARAYALAPPRPFFLVEAYYENEHDATEASLRAAAYWTVLSGGFGQVFGNCPLWSFGAPTVEAFCRAGRWQAALDTQGARNMSFLRTLFESRHWWSLVPDTAHAVLTSGVGTFGASDYATAAWAADGSSVIAYLPSARPVTVSGARLAGSTMTAWWYDPGSGTAIPIGTFATSGPQTFTPPSSGDWVLVLDSRRFAFPPPGR
jgi:hypothetical protein